MLPDEVRKAVERLKGERWEEFAWRHGDWGRGLFLWGARQLCGLTLRELGEAAGGMTFSAVSKAIRRLEQQAEKDKRLRQLQQRLLNLSNVEP